MNTVPPRDYARLHWKWHRDKVLRAVNREAPGALALWPVLIALSKEQSNAVTNPAGTIETSWDDLADEAMLTTEQVTRIVELLAGDAEMIEVTTGRMGVQFVSLARFSDWQVPRESKAEHQQLKRDRTTPSRDFVAERGVRVEVASLPFTETETEKEEQLLLSTAEPSTPVVAAPSSTKGPDRQLINGVFAAWVELFHRQPTTTKLDAKRKARIVWALTTYGKDDVWRCLKGYAADPWRHEAPNRNEIRTLFRGAAEFEAGLEKANGSPTTAGTTSADDFAGLGYR